MTRELSKRRRPAPQAPTLLSDLARLPLEAAVDMVCAGLSAAPTVGPLGDRDLAELTHRLGALAPKEPERVAACALRVVAALAQLAPELLPDARVACAQELSELALVGGATADPLVGALLERPERLGSALLRPVLRACRRDDRARAAAVDALTQWDPRQGWQEHHGADARDGLASALVEQAVAAADLPQALAVAAVWPPMRTALTRLGAALAATGDVGALTRLAARYDRRGGLLRSLLETALQVAASRGAAGEAVAAWVFTQAPSEAHFEAAKGCTDPRVWPARRAALVGTLLDRGEAAWVVASLAAEADAAAALTQLVVAHGRRPRTVDAALAALTDVSAPAAFALQGRLLLALVRTGSAPVRSVTRAVAALTAAAEAMGEPPLAASWLGLVRRELGADSPALRALSGPR